jgi:hypothetical protein
MLHEVVRRHFKPMFAMLDAAIAASAKELPGKPFGLREHIYHTLVSMDIWLHPNPAIYHFGEIEEDEAAQLQKPLSPRMTTRRLRTYLRTVEEKLKRLLNEFSDLLEEQTLKGKTLTILDRCLAQLRHTQHHIGSINSILRNTGGDPIEWQ